MVFLFFGALLRREVVVFRLRDGLRLFAGFDFRTTRLVVRARVVFFRVAGFRLRRFTVRVFRRRPAGFTYMIGTEFPPRKQTGSVCRQSDFVKQLS